VHILRLPTGSVWVRCTCFTCGGRNCLDAAVRRHVLHSTVTQELDKLAGHVSPVFLTKWAPDVNTPQVSSEREDFGSAVAACEELAKPCTCHRRPRRQTSTDGP
jgi:hypothetical protein